MTEDFLERMHMANQDDDDPDLQQLKQLRQVWLAMPDEEPPTRGLDALMAAARTQAAAMEAKPSWWKRMLAAMVRPPALALATIVVVAGGAVLVNRHRDELDATRAAPVVASEAPTRDEEPHRPEGEGAGDGDRFTAGPGGAASGSAAVAAPPVAPPTASPAKDQPSEHATPPPQVVHAAVPKKPMPKPASPAKLDAAETTSEAAKPIVVTKVPPADPTTRDGASKAGAAQIASDNAPTANQAPESLDSLLRRAREAAVRGDCATANSLAAQIAKRDLAYYRGTAAKDPAVAKCATALAE